MHFHHHEMYTHFSIAFILGALIRLRLEFMSLRAFVMISVCFFTSSGVSSYKIHKIHSHVHVNQETSITLKINLIISTDMIF